LWVGTAKGLVQRNAEGGWRRFGNIERAIAENPIRVLASDPAGVMWTATPTALYRWDTGFHEIKHNGTSIENVTALVASSDGMWIGTPDRVQRWQNAAPSPVHDAPLMSELEFGFDPRGKLVDAGPAAALPGMLALDARGALWIGRADGLWVVNRDVVDHVDPRPVTALIAGFVANEDGVFALETGKLVRVLDQCAAAIICEGRRTVWAATDVLSVAATAGGTAPPLPRIQRFDIAGATTTPIHTTGGDAEIAYTVVGSAGVIGVEFRYRLDGRDQDWISAGARTNASYADLSPGKYVFRVAARTQRSGWSNEAVLPFVLDPRFWQTGWFHALVLTMLIVAAVGLAFAGRVRRLRRERVAARAVEQRIETEVTHARETERFAAYGQMVAGVAHEVRQPLFAITTTSYVIREKLKDPDLASQVALLDREAKRMASLMDDLLDFARPAQLLKGPTALAPLLAETLEVVSVDPQGPPIVVDAIDVREAVIDRGRMQQVLINLLQNARKHAHGATRIALSAHDLGERIAIEVRDDGAGIPPERLSRLFEPFFTTGNGTGLGLPIAKRIVELHDGTLEVRSDERGTCFVISIPRGT
ncbi:MAG TPA: ATP-binding protein, partial [Kofleriaceae bacterium]